MEKLGGITIFLTLWTLTAFQTWFGRILYCIYIGLCFWFFDGLTPYIIVLISNLFTPFYLVANSMTGKRR